MSGLSNVVFLVSELSVVFLEIFIKTTGRQGLVFKLICNTAKNFFRAIVGTNKDFFLHNLAKLDLIATLLNEPYDQQNKDMSIIGIPSTAA